MSLGHQTSKHRSFLHNIVAADLANAKYPSVRTRFPPEPNGHLHIGHAKSIVLNFEIAKTFGGQCNLRMDHTNPCNESLAFAQAIEEDVCWLLSDWALGTIGLKGAGAIHHHASSSVVKSDIFPTSRTGSQPTDIKSSLLPYRASDYFDKLYDFAVKLIEADKAYVCDLSTNDVRKYRGAPHRPGTPSPYRTRTRKDNLALFSRMKDGAFPDGACTLRAKIDLNSSNIWMRDPVLYRIRHANHHQTADKWCIYPMYDFAHCLSDYIEGITHSFCTLEFDVHRPLYDWLLAALHLPGKHPRQYEFSRLRITYTVLSKRKLKQLVTDRIVTGWDDPRMPTISGMRRRGVPPEAIRSFIQRIGVTRYNGVISNSVLEHDIRASLNRVALRRFAVLRPLRVILTNYPANQHETFYAPNNPFDKTAGHRPLPFGAVLFIERDDFMEFPHEHFQRLRPGGSIRLKHAYLITCTDLIKDQSGQVTELHCTVDYTSKSTSRSTACRHRAIHWVSASNSVKSEVRLYSPLFAISDPDASSDYKKHLNEASLEIVTAECEPSVQHSDPSLRYQFERVGYFTLDRDSSQDALTFIRTAALKSRPLARFCTSRPERHDKTPPPPGLRRLSSSTVATEETSLRTPAPILRTPDLTIHGRLVKIATLRDELWKPDTFARAPQCLLTQIRNQGVKADILSLIQYPLHPVIHANHHCTFENFAGVPISTFSSWLNTQASPDVRQNIRKSRKYGVHVVRLSPDKAFFEAVTRLYNETPMRQGKPFGHFGKDLQAVTRANSSYSENTIFFGAYLDSSLVGFLQLLVLDDIADIKQLLISQEAYALKPSNALIGSAVDYCASNGLKLLLYGQFHYHGYKDGDSLVEFKRRHGFLKLYAPRYFIPLTTRGRLALLINLHLPIKKLIPEDLVFAALRLRSRFFSTRLFHNYMAYRSKHIRLRRTDAL